MIHDALMDWEVLVWVAAFSPRQHSKKVFFNQAHWAVPVTSITFWVRHVCTSPRREMLVMMATLSAMLMLAAVLCSNEADDE